MPTYDTLLYDKHRHGVLITWNRPETLNAISREMERELSDALKEAVILAAKLHDHGAKEDLMESRSAFAEKRQSPVKPKGRTGTAGSGNRFARRRRTTGDPC